MDALVKYKLLKCRQGNDIYIIQIYDKQRKYLNGPSTRDKSRDY